MYGWQSRFFIDSCGGWIVIWLGVGGSGRWDGCGGPVHPLYILFGSGIPRASGGMGTSHCGTGPGGFVGGLA